MRSVFGPLNVENWRCCHVFYTFQRKHRVTFCHRLLGFPVFVVERDDDIDQIWARLATSFELLPVLVPGEWIDERPTGNDAPGPAVYSGCPAGRFNRPDL